MDGKTAKMVVGLLAKERGDVERLARWMSRSLGIGGVGVCRRLIHEALAISPSDVSAKEAADYAMSGKLPD